MSLLLWVALCVIGAGLGQRDSLRHHRPRDPHDRLPGGTACPNCLFNEEMHGEREREEEDPSEALRLEAIKRQILSKLGLKAKPNVTEALPRRVVLETLERTHDPPPPPPPPTTTHHPDSEQPDDFYATTSEIIAFAEPGSMLNGQTLLEFPEAGISEGAELRVKSARLWVRVDSRHQPRTERNLTLWVFRLRAHLPNATRLSGKDFDSYTEMSGSLGVRASTSGWLKVDVTGSVSSWYRVGPRERLRLLVDCSGCGRQAAPALFQRGRARDHHRPFLVVRTEPSAPRRVRRRALDCSGATGGQCCKQRFYVSFKRLGWDDWVIAPSGYYANYCRGDCSAHRTPDTFLNHYTHVIEEYRKTDGLAGLQPCCAPLRFSSTSLIYYGPDMNIIKRDLPKMVVEECGCP